MTERQQAINECVQVARRAIDSAQSLLDRNYDDETWRFSMNEMSQEVNERFCEAMELFRSIDDAILRHFGLPQSKEDR